MKNDRLIEQTKALRRRIDAVIAATQKLVRVDDLSPEDLHDLVDLYEHYEIGRHYVKDEVFQYEGKLYKVLKGLVSQEQYMPNETPSEYLPMQPDGVIPEWRQPTGQHDAYMLGEKVIYNSQVYISTENNNVWVPGVFGWDLEEK